MRDDYTEQFTSDILAPSFHINARIYFLKGRECPIYYQYSMIDITVL